MKKLLISFVFYSIFVFGCGGSEEVKSEKYQDPDFDTYMLESIAILPIQNNNLSISEAKEIDKYFFAGISKNKTSYIPPDVSIEKIKKDGLEEKYNKFLNVYSGTGIQDTETLKELGTSLKCNAIYQGIIYDVKKKNGKFGEYVGETSATVKYTLFSVDNGKVLREAFATAMSKNSTTVSDAPPLIDVVRIAMKKIVAKLSPTN